MLLSMVLFRRPRNRFKSEETQNRPHDLFFNYFDLVLYSEGFFIVD